MPFARLQPLHESIGIRGFHTLIRGLKVNRAIHKKAYDMIGTIIRFILKGPDIVLRVLK